MGLMKTLIVFDSRFGNTEKIAQDIRDAISSEVRMLRPKEANLDELGSVDLLIVGSPTWGGRPSFSINNETKYVRISNNLVDCYVVCKRVL